jgi:hypothetical protein
VGANGDGTLAGEMVAAALPSEEVAADRNGENSVREPVAEGQPEGDVAAPIPAPPEKTPEAE